MAARPGTWGDIRVESCIEVDPTSPSLLTSRNRATVGQDGWCGEKVRGGVGHLDKAVAEPLWHWREGSNLTECRMSRLPEKELELAMEAIQRRKSSLLKRTAMLARTVASADREQEQRAPNKEQERRMGLTGSWWHSPDDRRGGRAPRRAAPTRQRARRGQ